MAPVDEDGELHRAGAAEVAEGVERGADGAAGEEDVVDEDDEAAVEVVTGDLGAADRAGGLHPQVVAVHGDVEGTDRDLRAGDLFELGGQPAGQVHTAGGDAEEHHVVGALGAFDDLVGDTGQDRAMSCASSTGRAESEFCWASMKRTSFSASRDGP